MAIWNKRVHFRVVTAAKYHWQLIIPAMVHATTMARLYFKMLGRGDFVPNSYTYVPLLGCCAKMGCAGTGKKCHGQAVKNGVEGVLPVQNSLIHMYGSCGVVEIARMLFDEMQQRDSVSWNARHYVYVCQSR